MPYILMFIGTIFIYLYEVVAAILLRKKAPSFKKVLSKGNELRQKGVGCIFIMLLLLLIYLLGSKQW